MSQEGESQWFPLVGALKSKPTQELERIVAEAVGTYLGMEAMCSISSIKFDHVQGAAISLKLSEKLPDDLPF